MTPDNMVIFSNSFVFIRMTLEYLCSLFPRCQLQSATSYHHLQKLFVVTLQFWMLKEPSFTCRLCFRLAYWNLSNSTSGNERPSSPSDSSFTSLHATISSPVDYDATSCRPHCIVHEHIQHRETPSICPPREVTCL